MEALASFHPAVRTWFERRFPSGPTEPQRRGWPAIAAERNTLIAAPTGSGKTLAAFLVCIDRLYRAFESEGSLADETSVVYVSPLKALAVDIQQNLETPLAEIRAIAEELGLAAPAIRAVVRSGDTRASARAAMLRKPPHLLVTTPESLFLLVTSERSRENLRRVRSVIVDEIHAVARDKRGSHLALTLARLDALCEARPIRIGLSATQRPIEVVARLLVGGGGLDSAAGSPPPDCHVVDSGHRRELDLAIEVPGSDLEAVASHEQWAEIVDRVAELVRSHRTTLVFSNTRRLAERFAHLLEAKLGSGRCAAHHGSLSKQRRLRIEDRLRAGDLDVLVATASLELGIDIGPVDLVCQLGSPRSIATFLQRVGRSGHSRGDTPKGRLFPVTRDELVECAALLRGVGRGNLDRLRPPEAPLDILAQQIVAACAADEWSEDGLFALMRSAAPFASLSRSDFDAVLEMLAEGIETGRGRRAAYLHRDRVHARVRGRRGARLAALTSGGAIPDTADYRVVADPDDTFVGTVNEDWAIESMAGDVFLLGSTSWRIRRVETGVVRVSDAAGAPPTIPFWLGEAPTRSEELSVEVSDLRTEVAAFLERGDAPGAERWLEAEAGLSRAGAEQIVRYIAAVRTALGVIPTRRQLVVERFFDETGGMQLVVHSPHGGRVNRGFGLALRKRICRSFDFELQAAANDDALVLSLGPQHSFALDDFLKMLSSRSVREALSQAVLASPMFTARWRWNLGRSLAVLRFRGGRRNPPPIQRMQADDLMAAIFPRLAGCQENQTGPIEIPDQPIVNQTMHDCLHEAMDVDALVALLEAIESGAVAVRLCDSTEPSLACHEILNGKPFTFLDDAPLEERRTRAVALRRGLPLEARDLARLDPDAIARVREQARPDPRDPDELHDVLLRWVVARPVASWAAHFDALVRDGRAAVAATREGRLWFAIEKQRALEAMFPDASIDPERELPPALAGQPAPDAEAAVIATVRGHLETAGPCTLPALAAATALREVWVEQALAHLEGEGFVLRGEFEPEAAGGGRTEHAERESSDWSLAVAGSQPPAPHGREQFCARSLLTRIHAFTQDRLRREIEPVSAQDFMRFLLRWQHATPQTRREGRRGLLAAIEQLQGFELAAGAWEESVLSARLHGYRREWLDDLCLSGEVVWGRVGLRATGPGDGRRGGAAPSRATPISLALRHDLPFLLAIARGEAEPALPGEGAARDLLHCLETRGAAFPSELAQATRRLPIEIEEGLWELVSRGLVTADGFHTLRSLLASSGRWAKQRDNRRSDRRLRRGVRARAGAEGRWALLPAAECEADRDALAEAAAEQLLARYGVIFYHLLARESLALPWREIAWALRRLEARGTVRGGRFVTGFSGEQFALPGAVDALRRTRKLPRDGEVVRLSAADPLNLIGILTPGLRVPAVRSQTVCYRDGLPIVERESNGYLLQSGAD